MQRLPKKERLHGETIIHQLFDKSKRFTVYPLRIHYIPRPTQEKSRIVISIPKRLFKQSKTYYFGTQDNKLLLLNLSKNRRERKINNKKTLKFIVYIHLELNQVNMNYLKRKCVNTQILTYLYLIV